ncbi:hypothetical protein BDF14DRAFT_1750511 [Spinellus fusiger]|nr:hypothetical protein BDF14DRAFT_1750511 [Spinellus fusiger]
MVWQLLQDILDSTHVLQDQVVHLPTTDLICSDTESIPATPTYPLTQPAKPSDPIPLLQLPIQDHQVLMPVIQQVSIKECHVVLHALQLHTPPTHHAVRVTMATPDTQFTRDTPVTKAIIWDNILVTKDTPVTPVTTKDSVLTSLPPTHPDPLLSVLLVHSPLIDPSSSRYNNSNKDHKPLDSNNLLHDNPNSLHQDNSSSSNSNKADLLMDIVVLLRLPPSAQGYSQSSSQPHPPSQSQPPKLTPQISEEIDSPPRSPNPNAANSIKDVLYHNEHSEVFRWKDETWYAVEGQCELEVRQTMNNRSCVAIRLQDTGELYLNAWILPTTVIHSISATDVSLTVFMGSNPENYLIHFEDPADATALSEVLQKTHYESVAMDEQNRNSFEPSSTLDRSDSLASITAPNGEEHQADPVPQTLEAAMQCKCKLFVQNEHSNWSSFGAVNMKISQQMPSKKMFIEIESEKGSKTTKLVSASVHSRNVERINTKRISFLLINEKESISIVYMVKVKEDQIGNSIYEYIKTKNAENGW